MAKQSRWIFALAAAILPSTSLSAQNLSGDWQGTIKTPSSPSGLRLVLHITKGENGGWKGTFYSIDERPEGLDGVPISTLALQGSDFKFSLSGLHVNYDGKLSRDGNSIDGTWSGREAAPLDFKRATKATAWKYQLPQHIVSFVTVDKDVKVEVLDYGGSGRALIFLPGLGATAHVFDQFAPKFTADYHVYGITPRGFGESSAPAPANGNYSADRLGDDVLAVMDALKLERPVLVGHSVAGEELSSVGSRHPEKVAGLIYLDAGYPYAFYDRSHGNFTIDAIALRKKLENMMIGGGQSPEELVQELLNTDLPQIENDLREERKQILVRPPPSKGQQPKAPPIQAAIIEGERKFTAIDVPVLAFFADPHDPGQAFKNDAAARARLVAWDKERMEALIQGFERGIPQARVVRLPNADHFVIDTNGQDVLREMNSFLATLH
jgi:non-heme chloroperoxidase